MEQQGVFSKNKSKSHSQKKTEKTIEKVVKWVIFPFGILYCFISVWIVVNYVAGLVECTTGASPNPAWCSPVTVQAWGATLLYVVVAVLTCTMFVVWAVKMIRNFQAGRVGLSAEVASLVTSTPAGALRFTHPDFTAGVKRA